MPQKARLCHGTVLNISLTAGGAASRGLRASGAEMTPPRRMVMRRGVRARRFPRKTQAGASIGKADRASSGGRGSNVSQSGAFVRRSRTNAQASRPRTHDAFAHVEHGLSLRQWILPPVPEQNRTLRATPPTRYDRAFAFSRKTAFQLSEIQGEFFR